MPNVHEVLIVIILQQVKFGFPGCMDWGWAFSLHSLSFLVCFITRVPGGRWVRRGGWVSTVAVFGIVFCVMPPVSLPISLSHCYICVWVFVFVVSLVRFERNGSDTLVSCLDDRALSLYFSLCGVICRRRCLWLLVCVGVSAVVFSVHLHCCILFFCIQIFGVTLLFMSLCFDGGTGAYEDKLMNKHHVGPFDLMFNIQFAKMLLAFIGLVVFGQTHVFMRVGWSMVLVRSVELCCSRLETPRHLCKAVDWHVGSVHRG